jgi:hypothetical protein
MFSLRTKEQSFISAGCCDLLSTARSWGRKDLECPSPHPQDTQSPTPTIPHRGWAVLAHPWEQEPSSRCPARSLLNADNEELSAKASQLWWPVLTTALEAMYSSAVEEALRATCLAKALWPVGCRASSWAMLALGLTPPSSSVYLLAHPVTPTSLL